MKNNTFFAVLSGVFYFVSAFFFLSLLFGMIDGGREIPPLWIIGGTAGSFGAAKLFEILARGLKD